MSLFIDQENAIMFNGTFYKDGREISAEKAIKCLRDFGVQEVLERLKEICNKSKTEMGLSRSIGNLIREMQ